jgi:hypothetical protein
LSTSKFVQDDKRIDQNQLHNYTNKIFDPKNVTILIGDQMSDLAILLIKVERKKFLILFKTTKISMNIKKNIDHSIFLISFLLIYLK